MRCKAGLAARACKLGRFAIREMAKALDIRYTKGGDSGSLVLDQATGKAVGLHFAGAKKGSVFNPIGEVLSALGVKLVTRSIPGGKISQPEARGSSGKKKVARAGKKRRTVRRRSKRGR